MSIVSVVYNGKDRKKCFSSAVWTSNATHILFEAIHSDTCKFTVYFVQRAWPRLLYRTSNVQLVRCRRSQSKRRRGRTARAVRRATTSTWRSASSAASARRRVRWTRSSRAPTSSTRQRRARSSSTTRRSCCSTATAGRLSSRPTSRRTTRTAKMTWPHRWALPHRRSFSSLSFLFSLRSFASSRTCSVTLRLDTLYFHLNHNE